MGKTTVVKIQKQALKFYWILVSDIIKCYDLQTLHPGEKGKSGSYSLSSPVKCMGYGVFVTNYQNLKDTITIRACS